MKYQRNFSRQPSQQPNSGRPDYNERNYNNERPYNSNQNRPQRSSSNRNKNSSNDNLYDNPIRLNRLIAMSGFCSRRKADSYIEEGAVKINGQKVTDLGIKVNPREDRVEFKGTVIKPEKPVYILLNKPKNHISTTDDPEGRRTIMDLVRNVGNYRIFPVGRLDRNTTGILLMTNDGELAKRLTHPSYNISKVYRALLSKELTQEDLKKLLRGLELEDGFSKFDKVAFTDKSTSSSEVLVQIHSGRNHIIKRMFAALHYEVLSLDRISFGPITKKGVARSHWRYLTAQEVNFLKMASATAKRTIALETGIEDENEFELGDEFNEGLAFDLSDYDDMEIDLTKIADENDDDTDFDDLVDGETSSDYVPRNTTRTSARPGQRTMVRNYPQGGDNQRPRSNNSYSGNNAGNSRPYSSSRDSGSFNSNRSSNNSNNSNSNYGNRGDNRNSSYNSSYGNRRPEQRQTGGFNSSNNSYGGRQNNSTNNSGGNYGNNYQDRNRRPYNNQEGNSNQNSGGNSNYGVKRYNSNERPFNSQNSGGSYNRNSNNNSYNNNDSSRNYNNPNTSNESNLGYQRNNRSNYRNDNNANNSFSGNSRFNSDNSTRRTFDNFSNNPRNNSSFGNGNSGNNSSFNNRRNFSDNTNNSSKNSESSYHNYRRRNDNTSNENTNSDQNRSNRNKTEFED